jgi:hypothetical protein
MDSSCPNPWCRDGLVGSPVRGARHFPARSRLCPVCHGRASIDERDADLREAGIVVADATDEDFRSSPTLWQG